MDDIGSEEWIERLRARAAVLTVDAEARLRIEQNIDGDAAWHVTIADGAVEVGGGPDPDADVSLSLEAATAADLAAGRRSAQRAFLDGDLRIGGDIAALLAHRDVLVVVADLLRAM